MRRSFFAPAVQAAVVPVSFCLAVGLAASAAHACAPSPPDRNAMYPGLTLIRPDMALLLPILSGAMERPLYALAGLRDATSTLAFSIQSNLLAMLAGIAATIGFVLAIETTGVRVHSDAMLAWLMWLGLPAIAAGVKYCWLGRLPNVRATLPLGPVVVIATAASTTAIASIPFWMHLLGTDTYAYAERVQTLKWIATLAVLIAAIATHVMLFSRFSRPARRERRRGFDIVSATPVAQAVR